MEPSLTSRENKPLYLISLFFLVLGPLTYAWIVTNNTWNFFGWEHSGLIHNDYFLSLMKGSLSLTPHIVGLEGFYIGDHVYTVHGVVPALFRIFLAPFVDLKTTYVTRLTTWLTASAGAAVMMWMFLRLVTAGRARSGVASLGTMPYIAICIAIWFTSPFFLMMGKAYFYHEQYSFGLLFIMLYLALLADEVLVKQRPPEGHLIALSILAGVSLHTRITYGAGLYAMTVGLVALAAWRHMKQEGSLASALRPAFLPLLIMFVFGVILLTMNYVRFGNIFGFHIGKYYGFNLFGHADMFVVHKKEGLKLLRMIPTTLFDFVGGSNLHTAILDAFGLMHHRVERPYGRVLFMWTPLLALAAYGFVVLLRRDASMVTARRCFSICALGLAIPMGIMLAYPLITVRYRFDMWPFFTTYAIVGFPALLAASARWSATRNRIIGALMIALSLGSAYYTTNIVFEYKSMRLKDKDYKEITTIPIIRDYFMIVE